MPVDASAVGSRVVVRSRLGGHGPGGGPAMTDVVGILVAADPYRLTVRRRDGTLVDVRVGDVVTAKKVSGLPGGRPGTGLRIDAEDLQRVTDTGWPAPVSQPLGEWLLRAASGFTGRANSVSVHGSPARPFDRALGWLLVPLGRASLYVFVLHVPAALVVANVPGLDGTSVALGTLAHGIVLGVLWTMVRTQVLFRIIPH